jgi:hypothetical protein
LTSTTTAGDEEGPAEGDDAAVGSPGQEGAAPADEARPLRKSLKNAPVTGVERRQVIDIPPVEAVTAEHQLLTVRCGYPLGKPTEPQLKLIISTSATVMNASWETRKSPRRPRRLAIVPGSDGRPGFQKCAELRRSGP